MQTLSYGFKLPDTGDRGIVVFPALEFNIQRLNDHNHEGTNSIKLSSAAIAALTSTILPAAWTLVSPGIFRALVTMPSGMLFDSKAITLRSNNRALYADIQRFSANTFYVLVNDSTLTVTVVYA